jgi:hypothetical protein
LRSDLRFDPGRSLPAADGLEPLAPIEQLGAHDEALLEGRLGVAGLQGDDVVLALDRLRNPDVGGVHDEALVDAVAVLLAVGVAQGDAVAVA